MIGGWFGTIFWSLSLLNMRVSHAPRMLHRCLIVAWFLSPKCLQLMRSILCASAVVLSLLPLRAYTVGMFPLSKPYGCVGRVYPIIEL
jgi:hypothetical protein